MSLFLHCNSLEYHHMLFISWLMLSLPELNQFMRFWFLNMLSNYLSLYPIETPFITFAIREDPDQAALIRAA